MLYKAMKMIKTTVTALVKGNSLLTAPAIRLLIIHS